MLKPVKRMLSLLCAVALLMSSVAGLAEGGTVFGVAIKGDNTAEYSEGALGEYIRLSIEGSGKKHQLPGAPREAQVEAGAGQTVLEAWTLDGIKGKTALTLTAEVTALPGAGAALSLYAVNGDALGDLLEGDAAVGDRVTLELTRKGPTGIAAVAAAPEEDGDGELIEGAIWANDEIYLTGKMPRHAVVVAEPVTVEIEGAVVLSAYDVRIYANEHQRQRGRTWKPAGSKVQVHFRLNRMTKGDNGLSAYLLDGESAEPELVAQDLNVSSGAEVSFGANDFAGSESEQTIYAVASLIEREISAGGRTYKITVSYDRDAGLPEGVDLDVAEVGEDAYLDAATAALGVDSLDYARAFDISIVDAAGAKHQPNGRVSVSIQLTDREGMNRPQVVHIPEGEAPTVITPRLMGDTVSFDADGFSIYVITDDVDEDPCYVYLFVDDEGQVYNRQTVREGERVTTPPDPSVSGRIFRGWYMTHTVGGPGEEDTWEDPFQSFAVTGIPADSVGENARVFTVYGWFEDSAYLTFYNQDGQTVERLLTPHIGEEVRLGVRDVPYTPIPSGTTYYKHLGWTESSEMSERFPASEAEAHPAQTFRPMENHAYYPILLSGHWVYFNTNAMGDSVIYIEPEFVHGATAPVAPDAPVRAGYDFAGWYDQADGGNPVFNADGSRAEGFPYADGLEDNLSLYARWTPKPTSMTVVWWAQNVTDEAGIPDDEKTYDFIKEVVYTTAMDSQGNSGPIYSGNGVSARADWFVKPENHIKVGGSIAEGFYDEDPNGFVYNYDRSDHDYVPVAGDGSTTFNIYFDRKTYHLVFVNHDFVNDSNDTQAVLRDETPLAQIDAVYGHDLTGCWPLNEHAKLPGVTANIGQYWSWRAPGITPSSIANAFKSIPRMPVVNDGADGTTVYFSHNHVTASDVTGKSYSYVELDPDVEPAYAQAHQDDDVQGQPGVKKYVKVDNTWYEHRLTQGHAFKAGAEVNANTHITRGAYFFNIDGFSRYGTNVHYHGYPYSSSTYNRDADCKADSAVPYERKSDKNVYISDVKDMRHYYKRNRSMLRVMVKWADDNPVELYRDDSVPFEKDISQSFLTEKLDAWLEGRGGIPDYMEFTGWYTDENLTQQIRDFDRLEMPSGNLTLYAGIQKRWYVINIDPNGGIIDPAKNQTTWLWREYGDKSLSEYSIARDYVRRAGGEYSYVCYGRGYADESVRRSEYVPTGSAPAASTGVEVSHGYAYQRNAYTLLGWYELDHVRSDGTKVLKDRPYAFGSEITHSMTLVAKWRRNAIYRLNYLSAAVDDAGNTYTITPPTDGTDYAEGAGAVMKAPLALPEGMRLKCWRLMDGSTARIGESIGIDDGISVNLVDNENERIEEIRLTPVLEADPDAGEAGGSASDVRHYWFFTGRPGETDAQAITWYNALEAYAINTPEGQAALDGAAYYVENLSPGEALAVPTPPQDPTGQGRPFLGWYSDPNLTHRFNAFGVTGSPVNTRLYARFDPGWEVVYKDKAGNTIGKQRYARSSAAYLVTYGVTYVPNDGSMMLGWSSAQNSDAPEYAYNQIEPQSLVIDRDMILYPVTGQKQYLFLDSNGGSYVAPVVLYSDRRPESPDDEPVRPGYIFQGWFTQREGGEEYRFGRGNRLPEGVTTLYAHWQIQSQTSVDAAYRVLWWVEQSNGAYVFSNEITVANGVFVADRVDARSYAGLVEHPEYATAIIGNDRACYRLDHAVDAAGNTVYAIDGNGAVTVDGTMTVEDHGSELNVYLGRRNDMTLTLVANGGAFADLSRDRVEVSGDGTRYVISGITLGEDLTALWPTGLTRENYAIGCWNSREDGRGDDFGVGCATGDMLAAGTIYAKWRTTTPTPTTNAGGATYKVCVTYNLRDGANTHQFVEYHDIVGQSLYEQLAQGGFTADDFTSLKKDIAGYVPADEWFLFDREVKDENRTVVTGYLYEYAGKKQMYYKDGGVWEELSFTDTGSGFGYNSGYKYYYTTFYRTIDIVGSTVIYPAKKAENGIAAQDTITGITPQTITDRYDTSEKAQQNDYVKQTATPMTATEYHPGVIYISMFYDRDAAAVNAPMTWNLTFKDLEGGFGTQSQAHQAGEAIQALALTDQNKYPEYRDFGCWSETVNGEAYVFDTMPQRDVTLYAVWRTQPVTVTTLNTHSGLLDNKQYDGVKGAELGTFGIPEPLSYTLLDKEYVFDHWSDSALADQPVRLGDRIIRDTVIHAQWREKGEDKKVRVYYDLNGGALDGDSFPGATLVTEGPHAGQYVDDTDYLAGGAALALALNASLSAHDPGSDRDFKLVCWIDGRRRYYPGESIALGVEDVVLYASFSGYRETTLRYDLNAGDARFVRTSDAQPLSEAPVITFRDYLDLNTAESAGAPNTPYVVCDAMDGTRFTAIRVGYRLLGWSDDPAATAPDVVMGDRILVDTKNEANNVLYAVWQPQKLPVNVYTYREGDFEHPTGTLGTGEWFQSYLNTGDGWEAETLAQTCVSYAAPEGCHYAYSRVNGQIARYVRYVADADGCGYHWEYLADSNPAPVAFGEGEALNVYYYEWQTPELSLSAKRYAGGAWQTAETIPGSEGSYAFDQSSPSNLPAPFIAADGSGLPADWQGQSPARYDTEGYAYAFTVLASDGGIAPTALRCVRADDTDPSLYKWQYTTDAQGASAADEAWTDLPANDALVIYYFRTDTDVPVYYVTLGDDGAVAQIDPLLDVNGQPWKTGETAAALAQGANLAEPVSAVNYQISKTGRRLVVPGSNGEQDSRSLFWQRADGAWRQYILKGFAAATLSDGQLTVRSDVNDYLTLCTTASGLVYQSSDSPLTEGISAAADGSNLLSGPAILVVYDKNDAFRLSVSKQWVENASAANAVSSITLTFKDAEGGIVPLRAVENGGEGVTLGDTGTVALSQINGQWPDRWELTVPAAATAVEEAPVDGYLSQMGNFTDVEGGRAITVTNTRATCKIVTDGGFFAAYASLEDAFAAINGGGLDGQTDIRVELLVQNVPLTAGVTLNSGREVTLTTADPAAGDDYPYTGSGAATLSRGTATGSMIVNNGSLTVDGANLDGGNAEVSAGGALIASTGTLTIGSATLTGGSTAGNGGAICAGGGSVAIGSGASVTGNTAARGSAIYADGATVTVTGGSVTGNTATAESGGAMQAANGELRFEGAPTVTGNTGTHTEDGQTTHPARNVVVSDADTIVVTGPITDGEVGVTGGEGQDGSMEQFATYDAAALTGDAIAGSLNRFVNDVTTLSTDSSTHLRGIDGGSGRVIWQTSTFTVATRAEGSMGDRTKAFTVRLKLQGYTRDGSYTCVRTAADGTTRTEAVTFQSGTAEDFMEFSLKSGERVTLISMDVSAFSVNETDPLNGPYTVTSTLEAGDGTVADDDASIEGVTGGATTVTFINTLEAVSPTGVTLRFAPWLLMLGFGLAMLWLARRRRRDD